MTANANCTECDWRGDSENGNCPECNAPVDVPSTNKEIVWDALASCRPEDSQKNWFLDHLEDCNTHPLARALKALADHADRHLDAFGAPIGEDYVLGPAYLEAIRAIHSLLNGETGKLDCNLVSRACCALVKSAGFSGKDLL